MGQFISLNTEDTEDAVLPETKFFIPRNYALSINQIEQLRRENIRQGAPFEIANNGTQRSSLGVKAVRKSASSIYIDEATVKLTAGWSSSSSGSSYSLSFTYDATTDIVCSVYIRGKDVSSSNEIRLTSEMEYYGPFKLAKGFAVPYSLDMLLKREVLESFSTPYGDVYDLSLIFACPSSHQSTASPKKVSRNLKSVIPEQGSGCNQETVIEAMLFRADEISKGKNIQMKLFERRLQLSGSVFKVFSLYSSTISDGEATAKTDGSNGGDCVICLTNPVSVAVIPCRHCCVCIECAETIPYQGGKCPICRTKSVLYVRLR